MAVKEKFIFYYRRPLDLRWRDVWFHVGWFAVWDKKPYGDSFDIELRHKKQNVLIAAAEFLKMCNSDARKAFDTFAPLKLEPLATNKKMVIKENGDYSRCHKELLDKIESDDKLWVLDIHREKI